MKKGWFLLFLIATLSSWSQDSSFVDTKYLEDQIYLGVQYNSILSPNNNIDNNGIPYSFQIGFLKDLPINKQRNIGFALGLGYNFDLLRPNITIKDNNNKLQFDIDNSYESYRYTLHGLEVPVEFRWRTSTASKFSFWRIYTGASLLYNFSNQVVLNTGTTEITYKQLNAFRKIAYTVYTSIGYGTWNIHLKYHLSSPFTAHTKTSNGTSLDFHQLKLGVMFYIL
ncbi:porin family protein [Ochrovirga pacifica]|uniref:porin family protein n=1 Tax=Ochrovirga pacifica TaxID=1042376 RepID=UPI000255A519|nr:porin family protein [Ochrovirga pacifica]